MCIYWYIASHLKMLLWIPFLMSEAWKEEGKIVEGRSIRKENIWWFDDEDDDDANENDVMKGKSEHATFWRDRFENFPNWVG